MTMKQVFFHLILSSSHGGGGSAGQYPTADVINIRGRIVYCSKSPYLIGTRAKVGGGGVCRPISVNISSLFLIDSRVLPLSFFRSTNILIDPEIYFPGYFQHQAGEGEPRPRPDRQHRQRHPGPRRVRESRDGRAGRGCGGAVHRAQRQGTREGGGHPLPSRVGA